jgi:hypothetical protein
LHLETILTELKPERDRFNRAIAAVEGITAPANPTPAPAKGRKQGRRKMSVEARNKLSEAKKAWWAMKKKDKGAGRRRTITKQER